MVPPGRIELPTSSKRRAEALTLEALIGDWDRKHLSHGRETYRRDMVARIKRTLPGLLTCPSASLTRADVRRALDAARKGDHLARNGEASNAAARAEPSRDASIAATGAGCRAMFKWVIKAELVTANRFHNLPLAPAKPERDRWLDADAVGAVYAAAAAMPYPFGPLIKLLVLTGQRRNEVAGMRWSEIDLERSTWTMPADRQKNGKPHVVHPSAPALAILRALATVRRGSDLLLTTTVTTPISGFSDAKDDLDARSGVTGWQWKNLNQFDLVESTASGSLHPRRCRCRGTGKPRRRFGTGPRRVRSGRAGRSPSGDVQRSARQAHRQEKATSHLDGFDRGEQALPKRCCREPIEFLGRVDWICDLFALHQAVRDVPKG